MKMWKLTKHKNNIVIESVSHYLSLNQRGGRIYRGSVFRSPKIPSEWYLLSDVQLCCVRQVTGVTSTSRKTGSSLRRRTVRAVIGVDVRRGYQLDPVRMNDSEPNTQRTEPRDARDWHEPATPERSDLFPGVRFCECAPFSFFKSANHRAGRVGVTRGCVI